MSVRESGSESDDQFHQGMFSRLIESQEVMFNRLVRCQEEMLRSQEVMLKSQEAMFNKLVKFQEDMVKSQEVTQEAMFNKLIKSQEDMGKSQEVTQKAMFNKLVISQEAVGKSQVVTQEAMLNKLVKSQEDMVKSQKPMFDRLEDKLTKAIVQDPENADDEEEQKDGAKKEYIPIKEVPYVYPQNNQPKKELILEYELLYEAAESGKWDDFRELVDKKETINSTIKIAITGDEWEMGLNIAVARNQLESVTEILKRIPEELYRTTTATTTALHYAAMYGYPEHCKLLVEKRSNLTQIRDKEGRVPLHVAVEAVTAGQKETVKYLYSVTKHVDPSPFSDDDGARLLCGLIEAKNYDLAFSLVKSYPTLVIRKSAAHGICGLESIVQRPFAFKSGANLTRWQRKIYPSIPVNLNYTYNNGAQAVKQNPFSCCSEGTGGVDVENPSERSRGTVVVKDNPWKISYVYSIMDKVFHTKQSLYKRKLMHEQAHELVKEMFAQLDNIITDGTVLVTYFKDNSNIIKTAIKHGTIEVVKECLENFRFLIWEDLDGQTMIQMAIIARNEKILDFICESAASEKESSKDGDASVNKSNKDDASEKKRNKDGKMDLLSRKDKKGNTLLHHTATIARANLHTVCGTALQVQRELQWFKAVESIIPEEDRVKRNRKGNTAQYLFTEQHKKLVEEGGNWMKDTSGSCMVVAALIATVAFAAVFTVPGGNISDSANSKIGVPVFLGKSPFIVFTIADALALSSSITSVLMFLAIYTSRHAEEDFIRSLPQKLIIGLATLFISMAAILVAFGASLFIVVGDRFSWSPIPIGIFGGVPLILFARLQLPLFIEMVTSTYCSNLLQKHKYTG
ncbi:hypothetical protein MKX03_033607 [Papaver bracteatum]|nr:hypothetical protein MKX03_033607 [Papaver bracteatum]